MKKTITTSLLFYIFAQASSGQNVGVNTDGTAPEAGVMLDVKGTNSYSTTATQSIFQVKSADASTAALKLRIGLSTGASLYGSMDVYDATAALTRSLILQPTTGNVGIGTTTPAVRLTVKTLFSNTLAFWTLGTNGVTNVEAGSWSADNGAVTVGDNTGTRQVFLYSAGSSYFTGGNLGIGTTSPDMKLQVNNGSIAARNTANTQQNTVEAQAFDYVSLPSWKSTFIKYVDAGVAGNIFSGIPNANLGVVGFQNASNALIYTNGNTPLIFGTSSAEAMRISGAGNVGIGNTSPVALLDIKGTNATAHLRVTSNSGRASLVLTSDVGNTSGPIITWAKQNVGEFAMYTYNGAAKLAIVDAATGNDAFSIMGGKTTIGNGSGISGNSSLNVYGNASIGLTYIGTAAPANGLIVEGNVGVGTIAPTSKLQVVGLPVYANNAAALAGGLTAGAFYTTGAGDPRPVYIVF